MSLNEASLEKRFAEVSTSQGSIQSLSIFCLHYKIHHKRIAQIWLRCLQKSEVQHRLTLIYLANDIVQNAKRKKTLSFIEDFKSILKDTVPYLRDERIKKTVERVFSIWQDRNIFDAKFTDELKNLLNSKSNNKTNYDNNNKSSSHQSSKSNSVVQKSATKDLIQSLGRLKEFDKIADVGRSAADVKAELDERTKLSGFLEKSLKEEMGHLKECEEQLVAYQQKLECVKRLRDGLLSS